MEEDKSKIKMKLYNIMLGMRSGGGVSRYVYSAMEDAGIRIAVSRFFNWKNGLYRAKNPTPQMIASKMYFSEHKKESSEVMKLLSDEESKEVFFKIIKYRQTARHKDLPRNSYREQYFGNDFFKYDEGEVYVDCGAFDGDSVRKFKKLMEQKKITNYQCICFEPDINNYCLLKKNHPDALCYRAGVWEDDGELFFRVGHGDDNNIISAEDKSKYAENEVTTIPVQSIDRTKGCGGRVTYIKMDIEGAEQRALLGAKNTIMKNKPKLAISIYHSDEDMINIPLMLHKWVPEYRLYVKHHSNGMPETVLYATI